MITRTTIHDPFNELVNTVETFEYKDDAVLSDYLPTLENKEGITYVVAVNGKIVEDYSRPVKDEDRIAVSAKIEGSAVAGAIFGSIAKLGFWGTVGYVAVSTAVNIAISYGMNYLATEVFGPDKPSTGDAGTDESPTYSWGELQQTETPGNPIPIVFGEHRMSGQVINQFTENEITDPQGSYEKCETRTIEYSGMGNEQEYTRCWTVPYEEGDFKEYLNILLAVNDGEVDEITDIRVNDQPVNNYKRIETFTRLGTLDDDYIKPFGRIVAQNSINVSLNDSGSEHTVRTSGDSVEEIIIVFSAQQGLYYSNDEGGLDERHVKFKVEYKPADAEEYQYIDCGEVKVLGKKTEEIRKSFTLDNLDPPDQYDVRVTRLSGGSSSFREQKDVTWTTLKEVVKEKLIYPGLAKYAIKALATDQLSGQKPRISALVKRLTVQVYNADDEEWQTKDARNPAWATYALLNTYHNVHRDRILYSEFKEWAAWCDEDVSEPGEYAETRFRVNKVFDTQRNAWANVQEMARLGRGKIVRRGTKYGVFVDKADDTVSHLFTMGNIIEGSFNLQYLPRKDRANAVQISYLDPDKDYRKTQVAVYSEDYKDSESLPKESNIELSAAIPRNQAVREAHFLLNSNRYLIRTIEFEADVDSFACVVGDLVYFQHMVPHYDDSNSGRIVGAGNDDGGGNPYVQLDQEVELITNQDYAIMVRLADDSLVEKTLASISEDQTTDTLVLESTWSAVPEQYDLFVFGEADTYKRKYRITNITRAQELTRRITCMEYNDLIYSDASGIIKDRDLPDAPDQEAVRVEAHEFLTYGKGGDYQPNIAVSWHPGTHTHSQNWAVWIEDITTERSFDENFADLDDTEFQPTSGQKRAKKVAETGDEHVIIGSNQISIFNEYRIYVTPIDYGSAQDTGSNITTIQVLGKFAPPNDVPSFEAEWKPMKRSVYLRWTEIDNIDRSHYEIRHGSSWEDGTVVVKEAKKDSAVDPIDEGVNESRTYYIKAVDTSGIYSTNAVNYTVDINTADCPLETPTGLNLSTDSEIADDGSSRTTISISWDTNAEISDDFHHYEIRVIRNTDDKTSNYTTDDNQYLIEVLANVEYGVRVRAIDVSGNHTSWTSQETITAAKDEVPPSDPSNFSVTSFFSSIRLKWDHGGERDLSHFDIYRNDSDDFSGASRIGSGVKDFSGTDASYSDDPGDYTEYYYWIVAVDTSGNESNETGPETGQKLKVDMGDLEAKLVELDDDDFAKEPFGVHDDTFYIALPGEEGDWKPVFIAGTIDGSSEIGIDGNLTVDGTITTHALAAESVTAEKLAAESVTAEKIDVTDLSAINANLGTITAGYMESQNWGTTEGMQIDLNNEIFRIGGSDNPALEWDGTASSPKLVVDGLEVDTEAGIGVNSGGGLQIKSGGEIEVYGSINVIGNLNWWGNTARLRFYDDPHEIVCGVDEDDEYSSGSMQLVKIDNNTRNFNIGTSSYKWGGIRLYADYVTFGEYEHGDFLEVSNPYTGSSSGGTYQKVLECKIPQGGDIRVKWEYKTTNSGYDCCTRIQKNDSSETISGGSEHCTSSESYVSVTEDLSGFDPGDLIQVWLATQSSQVTGYARNFEIFVENPRGGAPRQV